MGLGQRLQNLKAKMSKGGKDGVMQSQAATERNSGKEMLKMNNSFNPFNKGQSRSPKT